MSDVTLLNLNMLYVRYIDRVERELHLPLGPLYLARALEAAGIEVDFRDYQMCERWDLFEDGAISSFLEGAADILLVSCMANLLPFSLLALRRYREAHPKCTLVLGGVGPTAVEEKILEACPWVDVVGVGEGERSVPLLVRTLIAGQGSETRDLSSVPGIVWRAGDRIVRNPAPPRIESLDDLPLPAYHLVDLSRYNGINLMSSRGCPFPCTFCSVAPIWGRTPHLRSAESIASEMQRLHDLGGVDLFLFQDEYFVSGAERVASVCRAISALPFEAKWKAFGRIDLTNLRTMEAMADAGCIEIRYGVESGSDRVLSRIKKGFTADRALEVLSTAVGIFPGVDAFYMWGFPFETDADFNQTLMHMVVARGMGVRILPSLLCYLPQTALLEELSPGFRESLEFTPELFPEYMLTGHEVCAGGRMTIAPEHEAIYRFIQSHRDIFPGFFHLDVEHRVMPRYRLLQKFGFYTQEGRHELLGSEVECCGAHSPSPAGGVKS